jgi:hypothetical protein
MSQQATVNSRARVWLLFRSGPQAGTRVPVSERAIRIGRAPDNEVVVDGADCGVVSLYHAEISRNGDAYCIRDLASTNGTWVNGERITEAEVTPPAVLQLGTQGPEFGLVMEDAPAADLNQTIEVPLTVAGGFSAAETASIAHHEQLLSSAVARARRIRAHGVAGQTLTIMRDVVEEALRQSRRRFRIIGYSLLATLITVSAAAAWKIVTLKNEKGAIDGHIRQLEIQLQKSNGGTDMDRLLTQLDTYQGEAENLQHSMLYRLGAVKNEDDFVTRQLREVMAEFGAEVYSIPRDFSERVNYYVEQDQGPNRAVIGRALSGSGDDLKTIGRILQEEQLPSDLAYIPLVESAFANDQPSAAGAVGPWQFMKNTAKAYGLRVDGEVDERKDLMKSTRATCKYLRDLILDFGAGSSVMLALAGYDSGAAKVKQAVARTVRDPIKQRNFWYLYRARALPLETREYVPKVFAAILIGRNPHHFGF